MPYAYYARLAPRQRAIYRQSNEIEAIVLPVPAALQPLVGALEAALATADRPRVERAAHALAKDLLSSLGVRGVKVKVLSRRPSTSVSELHGLYVRAETRAQAVITVWMRTAAHKRVVAFRTFVRTLLHELCHHLDYESLELPDSFHTEGFFKRESSLFKQLVGTPSKRSG
ncbi:MAG TPA: hypothetical protein VNA66_07210 [Gammaproteobacteria bacterium]|nr:hypothetical protein [Gammaproteobacteria bacterium]